MNGILLFIRGLIEARATEIGRGRLVYSIIIVSSNAFLLFWHVQYLIEQANREQAEQADRESTFKGINRGRGIGSRPIFQGLGLSSKSDTQQKQKPNHAKRVTVVEGKGTDYKGLYIGHLDKISTVDSLPEGRLVGDKPNRNIKLIPANSIGVGEPLPVEKVRDWVHSDPDELSEYTNHYK